jgi:hypothetical protein
MKFRKPEELNRLARVCWNLAIERSRDRPTRYHKGLIDVTLSDGTFIPAGEPYPLGVEHGLCESINWLAAEVLEHYEKRPWLILSGRWGYTRGSDKGIITDAHDVLARTAHPDDLDEFTVFADFSLHSAFWEDADWLPMAVRGCPTQKFQGGVKPISQRIDGSWNHNERMQCERNNLSGWLREATVRAIADLENGAADP